MCYRTGGIDCLESLQHSGLSEPNRSAQVRPGSKSLKEMEFQWSLGSSSRVCSEIRQSCVFSVKVPKPQFWLPWLQVFLLSLAHNPWPWVAVEPSEKIWLRRLERPLWKWKWFLREKFGATEQVLFLLQEQQLQMRHLYLILLFHFYIVLETIFPPSPPVGYTSYITRRIIATSQCRNLQFTPYLAVKQLWGHGAATLLTWPEVSAALVLIGAFIMWVRVRQGGLNIQRCFAYEKGHRTPPSLRAFLCLKMKGQILFCIKRDFLSPRRQAERTAVPPYTFRCILCIRNMTARNFLIFGSQFRHKWSF